MAKHSGPLLHHSFIVLPAISARFASDPEPFFRTDAAREPHKITERHLHHRFLLPVCLRSWCPRRAVVWFEKPVQ